MVGAPCLGWNERPHVPSGTRTMRRGPRDLLEAAYKASFEVYGELAAKHPTFNKVYEHWSKFRTEVYLWHRIAENSLESFTYSMYQAQGR